MADYNDYYVRAPGYGAKDGSSWDNAWASILNANGVPAGSRIWLADDHDETSGSIDLLLGTSAKPVLIACAADHVTMPPTAVSNTAHIRVTGSATISLQGDMYIVGVNFHAGTPGSSASTNGIRVGAAGGNRIYGVDCSFNIENTNNNTVVLFAPNTSTNPARITLIRPRFKLSSSLGCIRLGTGTVRMVDVTFDPASVTSTRLLQGATQRGGFYLFDGMDCSNLGPTLGFVDGATAFGGTIRIRNCRTPAGWTGSLVSGGLDIGMRVELINYGEDASLAPHNNFWIEEYSGSIKGETTYVMDGGASAEGGAQIAWKMETNGNASWPIHGLRSPEISRRISTGIGDLKTARVEILHASGAPLREEDVNLEVQLLNEADSPMSNERNDGPETLFDTDLWGPTGTEGLDQDLSDETWAGGLAGGIAQSLAVSFTPRQVGNLIGAVALYKPNTIVYVNPQLLVG